MLNVEAPVACQQEQIQVYAADVSRAQQISRFMDIWIPEQEAKKSIKPASLTVIILEHIMAKKDLMEPVSVIVRDILVDFLKNYFRLSIKMWDM